MLIALLYVRRPQAGALHERGLGDCHRCARDPAPGLPLQLLDVPMPLKCAMVQSHKSEISVSRVGDGRGVQRLLLGLL